MLTTPRTLVVLIVCFSSTVCAQTISPSIISPSGNTDQSDEISLEWTIGELAVSTYEMNGLMLTEGFHQPLLSVERLIVPENEPGDDLVIKIAPNPVKYMLSIEIFDSLNRALELQLFDATGRLVENSQVDSFTQNLEFDMGHYVSGFYVLRVIDPASQTILDAYKVSKID